MKGQRFKLYFFIINPGDDAFTLALVLLLLQIRSLFPSALLHWREWYDFHLLWSGAKISGFFPQALAYAALRPLPFLCLKVTTQRKHTAGKAGCFFCVCACVYTYVRVCMWLDAFLFLCIYMCVCTFLRVLFCRFLHDMKQNLSSIYCRKGGQASGTPIRVVIESVSKGIEAVHKSATNNLPAFWSPFIPLTHTDPGLSGVKHDCCAAQGRPFSV